MPDGIRRPDALSRPVRLNNYRLIPLLLRAFAEAVDLMKRWISFYRHQFVAEEGEQDMSWREAPPWAVDLLEMQYYIIMQNEALQAKLEDRSTRLSQKDQRALDQLMDILKGTNAKIDSAKQDK